MQCNDPEQFRGDFYLLLLVGHALQLVNERFPGMYRRTVFVCWGEVHFIPDPTLQPRIFITAEADRSARGVTSQIESVALY